MPHDTARANGLIHETSPYLLQHAHNPVEWRPWGFKAFAEARRRDVPIFLSVGYSTCYWCHVMERESFEDEATAVLLNERFVCVKVDREERPDVDDAYMAATQALTGRGGWPMSVFLEPESLRPYWAGTYFPREPRHGLPGFHQVIEAMSVAWRERRTEVLAQAESVAEAVEHQLAARAEPRIVGEAQVTQAVSALLTVYDRVRGGFGGAPKFPQPTYLGLLMQVRPHAGDEGTKGAIEAAIRHTLDRMATGGIFDQVGGGFHRYSVDAEWLVPHFEKMLYDNAQLALIYAHASRDFQDEFYARTARRTLDYVLRGMTGREGGFFSAQDAEVDGREGLNYLWTREEVMEVLGADDGAFATDVYGLDDGPNFRDPHHSGEPPRNVLRLSARPESLARERGVEPSAFIERLDRINAKLLGIREARKQPGTDDKVLAGWNGLMIGAMADAGAILGDDRFVRSARRAADFVLGAMRTADGVLLRSFRAGSAKTPAFLEDYALMSQGLVALHRTAPDDGRYLAAAADLIRSARERFGDGRGGFFDTAEGEGDLFVRPSSTYDGAIPSGQSVMLHAMLDTHAAAGQSEFLDASGRLLVSLSGAIAESPVATSNSTRALMRMLVLLGEGLDGVFPPGTPPAAEAIGTPPADFTPVVVLASTDRISVAEGRPASFMLRMQIADGYHINAADPGPAAAEQGLTPMRVHAAGGTGLAVYADYPEGEPYGMSGELRVYRGLVEMRVAVEPSGDWSGRPLLALTYQACTETECLLPATVELDVAIDRG